MKAMIFAAGLGTRLKPLTNDRPKALVEFKGKTLLEHTIDKLRHVGVDHIVVNVHHYADKVIAFLHSKDFGVKIDISDERDELLDTGGGLLKASSILGDAPFFIHNVDILSDIDLSKLLESHMANKAVATVAYRSSESDRYFVKDDDDQLCGWGNKETGEKIICRSSQSLQEISFTGVHVLSGDMFKYINNEGPVSIIDAYLKAAAKERIYCFNCDKNEWMDVGTPEALQLAETIF